MAAGWTRDRLVAELERLIRRKVRLLASLKEGRVTQVGLDAELSDPQNELGSAAEQVPDGSCDTYAAVVAREEGKRRERLNGELESFLESEPELLQVFRCLWTGITKPAEIAQKVGIEAGRVSVLRKRLERRLGRFRERNQQKDAKGTKDL